jgi:hypothetical protein
MLEALAPAGAGLPSAGCCLDEPVFVLCNGRSGSTLLRFLLDAHPELACPPETNVPALCAQLATVWSLIEGAPLSANRGDEPPVIPDAAIAGVRATMDSMVVPYLQRRGKKRYCDKSLGTARFSELLLRVYPAARFVCLYRHPMDVIASGMEACPFGLSGYGFDPYIAATPGNTVLALARFWAENTAVTLAAEQQFPDRCLRVRYEDLVTDPETAMAEVFGFVGAAPAPGISAACFSSERERFGPADYKIWCTSKISGESIGRGWSVPAAMIASPVLAQVNELAAKLGYLPVDGGWGTCAPPADLRIAAAGSGEEKTGEPGPAASEAKVTGSAAAAAGAAADGHPGREQPGHNAAVGPLETFGAPGGVGLAADGGSAPGTGPALSRLLGERLRAGVTRIAQDPGGLPADVGAESFVAVWVPVDRHEPAEHWLVDLKARSVTSASGQAQQDSAWDIVGSSDGWERVISGKLNLSVALRACQLRYCDGDESGPVASEGRIALLAHLLALTSW